MPGINDLLKAAQAAPDAPERSDDELLDYNTLAEGERVTVKIVYCDARTKADNGAPQWINMLEVVSGEHAGGKFFDNITLSMKSSDGAKRYNKAQFAKLAAAGVTAEFLAGEPSNQAIAQMMKDKTVDVIIAWQKPDAKGTIWSQHVWAKAADPASGGYVPQSAPQGF